MRRVVSSPRFTIECQRKAISAKGLVNWRHVYGRLHLFRSDPIHGVVSPRLIHNATMAAKNKRIAIITEPDPSNVRNAFHRFKNATHCSRCPKESVRNLEGFDLPVVSHEWVCLHDEDYRSWLRRMAALGPGWQVLRTAGYGREPHNRLRPKTRSQNSSPRYAAKAPHIRGIAVAIRIPIDIDDGKRQGTKTHTIPVSNRPKSAPHTNRVTTSRLLGRGRFGSR